MTNRSVAPLLKPIKHIHLPEIKQTHLSNGIPIFEINTGTQDVIKIEIVFKAGRYYERKKLLGRATVSQLKEATKQFSGGTIADQMDYYGCSLSMPFNLDTSSLVLYGMKKHLSAVLPMIRSILLEPLFPESDLRDYINRRKKSLQVELSKNDVVAYRTVTEKIFGAHHPYGYNSFSEDYEALRREDLYSHFDHCFNVNNCTIIISGKTEDVKEMLDPLLSDMSKGSPVAAQPVAIEPQKPQRIQLSTQNHFQTAIRLGCPLFDRKHPDYVGFYVLNTILGGYFGSRLMANIREEKGYSYNIYSAVDPMKYGGYFYVGAEVGNEFVEKTLQEIYKEMDLLKRKLVGETELRMVKNYLSGIFLTMADGPFNVSELVKTMVTEDLGLGFYGQMIEGIQSITPQDLKQLANLYFDPAAMWEVIVA